MRRSPASPTHGHQPAGAGQARGECGARLFSGELSDWPAGDTSRRTTTRPRRRQVATARRNQGGHWRLHRFAAVHSDAAIEALPLDAPGLLPRRHGKKRRATVFLGNLARRSSPDNQRLEALPPGPLRQTIFGHGIFGQTLFGPGRLWIWRRRTFRHDAFRRGKAKFLVTFDAQDFWPMGWFPVLVFTLVVTAGR